MYKAQKIGSRKRIIALTDKAQNDIIRKTNGGIA